MSVAVMAAVWELELAREQKHVLLAFADHADDDGYCWPSLARIAWKCGYAQTRAVAEIVAKLGELGVLVRVEPPRGRTPSKYQIRTWRARRLPDFDPQAFKGAKNAPHEVSEPDNTLKDQCVAEAENARGAENAPQTDRGAEIAAQAGGKPVDDESVGVRSSQRRGAVSARRGALASAPESLTIKESKTRAREAQMEGRSARAKTEDEDRELRLLENSARNLRIPARGPTEPLEDFRRRVETAHGRALADEIERRRRSKAS